MRRPIEVPDQIRVEPLPLFLGWQISHVSAPHLAGWGGQCVWSAFAPAVALGGGTTPSFGAMSALDGSACCVRSTARASEARRCIWSAATTPLSAGIPRSRNAWGASASPYALHAKPRFLARHGRTVLPRCLHGATGARCLPRRASRKPSAPIGSLVRRKAKRYTSNAVEAEISGLQPGLAQSPETPDCAERLARAGG